ncbi:MULTISPECIES: 3'-5' exoribonuclease [unclassified Pseudomonas]|uniref:3'-5' exonuclease n=1 Tax=unclassified Pseudomonas TaxID=196821 RepID=UPI002448D479|nr:MULTISPECIES: 3'-5' exoribonuclease [unclassified Pseudomonas]MDH0894253.1 3'-5' exoribonuclease [Pseudomonas sp. GD03875]MDH1063452.1 3'-5' exoribonuclease [Pseudomonas sp. GD03985]
MINQTHFVLDLETMGKCSNAAIAAIGCVCVQNLRITNTFYRRVDLKTSLEAGLAVDASTLYWWLLKDRDAQLEIANPDNVPLLDALLDLRGFMGAALPDRVDPHALLWGKGSSFDNVVIGNAFDAYAIARPWLFRNDRDLRTLLALYPEAETLPFEGIKHHALDDAKHEARQLIMALQLHQKAQQGVPA